MDTNFGWCESMEDVIQIMGAIQMGRYNEERIPAYLSRRGGETSWVASGSVFSNRCNKTFYTLAIYFSKRYYGEAKTIQCSADMGGNGGK